MPPPADRAARGRTAHHLHVYLTPDARGTFLVTCGEVSSVVTFGQDEEEALARAELAIREALGGGPSAPDLPS